MTSRLLLNCLIITGTKHIVFAYLYGYTFVGKGKNTKSYVPLIADLFLAGWGWLDESPNDPAFCDLAQLTGMEMEGKILIRLYHFWKMQKRQEHD